MVFVAQADDPVAPNGAIALFPTRPAQSLLDAPHTRGMTPQSWSSGLSAACCNMSVSSSMRDNWIAGCSQLLKSRFLVVAASATGVSVGVQMLAFGAKP